jgi:hypothetical protein
MRHQDAAKRLAEPRIVVDDENGHS